MKALRRTAALAMACGALCAADPQADSSAAQTRQVMQGLTQRIIAEPSSHDMGGLPRADADVYSLYISSQDGPHCAFRLTCSAYAKLAIRKRGLLIGSLLAADRLLRCHGLGSAQYPVDSLTGKFLDPVP